MNVGIYEIFNTVNGKRYVGQSTDLSRRKRLHFSALARGEHHNAHLQRAFNAHGAGCFEWRILEEVCEDMLDNRERAWIAYYHTTDRSFGYNSDDGGSVNKHLSEEHRAKIAAALVGIKRGPPSAEHRRRMSFAQLGRRHSLETRAKISISGKKRVIDYDNLARMTAGNIGRSPSLETRAKMSAAQLGRKHSKETLAKMSASQLGRRHSLETRDKLSRIAKARYTRLRELVENRKEPRCGEMQAAQEKEGQVTCK